jgi:hypothetical protein
MWITGLAFVAILALCLSGVAVLRQRRDALGLSERQGHPR